MAEQATKNVMIVNYRPAVRGYPYPVTNTVDGFAKTENSVVYLKPGINLVGEDLLGKVARLMREDFDNGIVAKLDKPLPSMRVDEALLVIELTADLSVLEGWRKVETRDRINKAIDTQIDGIVNAPVQKSN